MTITVEQLVAHYRDIAATRMQGLPIVNERLEVGAVGFRKFGNDQVGVLITPWFMNLVLLPGVQLRDSAAQGTEFERSFPGGSVTMTQCRDDDLGDYQTAVLFRTMTDFPDQETARQIAAEILGTLFSRSKETGVAAPQISRRELFSRLGAA